LSLLGTQARGFPTGSRMRYSRFFMSGKQVFLSYALEDRETAQHLVRAIEARGWPISWERYEEPDAITTVALREALSASDCVVVLWSAHSVGSAAVREEANQARGRGALVQGVLDDASIPMPFILDEPTPLTDEWSLTTLVQQVARVLHEDASTLERESAQRSRNPRARIEARVLEIAEEHADAGELGKAIATYERWVSEKPHDMKAVRRLGDFYLAADRGNDAAAQYERVAEHYQASGFLVPAIESYERIVELAPESDVYRRRLEVLTARRALETSGTQQAMSSVQFTLTAPPYVSMGEAFALEVWAHRDHGHADILERLHDDNENSGRYELVAGAGPALTARVHIDGLDVAEAVQSLRWDRGLGYGSFRVDTSAASSRGGRSGVVGIYFLGLQIARVRFLVQISDTTTGREIIPSRQERHTRAIACYAQEDQDAVASRIRAFEKAAPGVDVSLAHEDLRSSEQHRAEFLDRISSRDVLYLFWSDHAARSRDVEREWRYALRLRGIDFIDPVPLVSSAVAPPPPELATLHDGNWQPVAEIPGFRPTPTLPEP
jgi:tetratricopeptide (TPR) repeat protein